MKALLNSPVVRYWLKFAGSLKLAMLLLAVLIIATITGTLVESKFDTSVAQKYVYDAPWFIVWLILLCINLIASVLVRYPWKPHQIGFVITHAGIVVMLVGAIVGRVWGFEGSITLYKGQQAVDYLLTGLQSFEGRGAGMSEGKGRTLNLNRAYPTPEKPEKFKLGEVEVAAIGFAPELGIQNRIEKGSGGAPALRLTLSSAMSPKPIERWLLLDDAKNGQVNFGPTVIRYRTQPSVATEAAGAAAAENTKPARELHFAFARMSQMNTSRAVIGGASGIKATYEFAAGQTDKEFRGTLKLSLDGQTYAYPLSDILGREVEIQDTGLKLKVSNYFADFRMNGKQPASISDQPNNPAVLFEILGPPVAASADAQCAHHQSGSCAHGDADKGCSMAANGCSHGDEKADPHAGHQHAQHGHADAPAPASELTIYRSDEGYLHYSVQTRSKESRGEIKVGEEFTPGLADWVCKVEEVTDSAVVRQELAPISDESIRRLGASGLKVRLSKAGQTHTQWIRMGQVTPIQFAGEKIDLNFGHKLHQLDFTVELEKFEVEMNEGTKTPASFKSFVKFNDAKNESSLTRAIWMNNPGNFPEFAGNGLLGTAYKFSQSSWNPGNLNETTLQVIRDPGWSFKWMGSLMLCLGLVWMFYIKPYPRYAKARAAAAAAAVKAPAPIVPAAAPVEVLVGK